MHRRQRHAGRRAVERQPEPFASTFERRRLAHDLRHVTQRHHHVVAIAQRHQRVELDQHVRHRRAGRVATSVDRSRAPSPRLQPVQGHVDRRPVVVANDDREVVPDQLVARSTGQRLRDRVGLAHHTVGIDDHHRRRQIVEQRAQLALGGAEHADRPRQALRVVRALPRPHQLIGRHRHDEHHGQHARHQAERVAIEDVALRGQQHRHGAGQVHGDHADHLGPMVVLDERG